MRLEIYVASNDERPHMPGTAWVFIDGTLHAKLRSGEAYRVDTHEDIVTYTPPEGMTTAELWKKVTDSG